MSSFGQRVAAALRDPWSLLITAVGAGSAWAVGLPVGGIAVVGAGVLGAAAVVGATMVASNGGDDEIELARGTTQRALVDELEEYRDELDTLRRGNLPSSLNASAADAVTATDSAIATSRRVAAAVDALDRAIGQAGGVARRLPGSGEVRGSIERMTGRRAQLLGKLATAVNGVGEVYAGLLELSATASLAGVGTDGLDEVSQVNESLDALRGAFDELERDATASRSLLR